MQNVMKCIRAASFEAAFAVLGSLRECSVATAFDAMSIKIRNDWVYLELFKIVERCRYDV
jgi:hypothetical protein